MPARHTDIHCSMVDASARWTYECAEGRLLDEGALHTTPLHPDTLSPVRVYFDDREQARGEEETQAGRLRKLRTSLPRWIRAPFASPAEGEEALLSVSGEAAATSLLSQLQQEESALGDLHSTLVSSLGSLTRDMPELTRAQSHSSVFQEITRAQSHSSSVIQERVEQQIAKWAKRAEDQQKKFLQACARRWMHAKLAAAWDAWAGTVRRSQAVRSCVRNWTKHTLARAWRTWEQCAHLSQRLTQAAGRWRHRRMSWAWVAWAERGRETKRRRSLVVEVLNRWVGLDRVRAFETWRSALYYSRCG